VRAIGSTIAVRPPHETDYEFFVSVLCSTMGQEWHEAQMERPERERHVVERWVETSDAIRSGEAKGVTITQEDEHVYSTTATGELKALSCLAYDVYTLRHASSLPVGLIKRLRNDSQFQGARYEIAIASVFARAGYGLDWLTATNRKLPEFIAHHPTTKTEIAVEAKSRHRSGVLGRGGEIPELDELKVDVGGLMRRALEKETDGRPFVVCLDLNLPTEQSGDFDEWVAELNDKVLRAVGAESTGQPDPFSAVFFTNYSWHWDGEKAAGNPMNFVVRPLKAAVPLPADEVELLSEALFQYGNVPDAVPRNGAR
jgi:hypothetical protein